MRSWHRFLPELVMIELQAFMRARSKSVTILSELQGAVKHELWKVDAPYDTKAIAGLKKYATGDGSATKADMEKAARRLWPACSNDDESDAFWLAHWGATNYEDIVHD